MATQRKRVRRTKRTATTYRQPDYRHLHNPFTAQTIFSADEVAAIHDTALQVLEELGLKVLLPEARQRLQQAGALVDESTQIVRIGREMVNQALATAPQSIPVLAGADQYNLTLKLGELTFGAGAGTPNATDRVRGRRPGTLQDFEDFTRLVQSFDAMHLNAPFVEPQDIPVNVRHYAMTRAQVVLSEKFPFVFARGQLQSEQVFAMLQIAREVTAEQFLDNVYCYTIINTNSPRQLDIPMAQGIIDFAKAGQLLIITPFCLSGAMAPITVAGALTLQHAECLAGIVLAQITRAGCPVMYGNFSSNVDMKSGAPAFGTPEHVKATLGSGQLARLLGLPWRAGAGSASNTGDAQGANENQMGVWAAVLAGATTVIHSAGWQEGGLCIGFEKFITDMEVVQSMAELCIPTHASPADIGLEAIKDVAPGGHFFSTEHTMQRYKTAFYEPLVADWSNYGTWEAAGEQTATERATAIWQQKLAEFEPPAMDPATVEALDAYIAKATEAGGAPPIS